MTTSVSIPPIPGALEDEGVVVQRLLDAVQPAVNAMPRIMERARILAQRTRETGAGGGIEAFLQEYGLGTREGVAVMCLAEALLRIPDPATADRLIADTFRETEWDSHLGHSDSLFVNASTWGLILTGKVMNLGAEKPSSLLRGLARRYGEPVIREALRKAMRIVGGQFVMGETIEDAVKNAATLEKRGCTLSFDMLGEGARNQRQADAYFDAYRHAIEVLGRNAPHNVELAQRRGISVKLSGLHPRYHLTQEARLHGDLLPRLKTLVRMARDNHLTLSIDAEEANRLDINLRLFAALCADPELKGYDGLGYVLQAYQKRAYAVIDRLAELASERGCTMPVRLVKGAYWDSEIKSAQVLGLESYPVFTRKEHTDVSYLACAAKLLEHGDTFFPQFATHNAHTAAAVMELAAGRPFELQRLHGMGEALYKQLEGQVPVRIYAPVGRHEDLLAYLIRRLLENGANTSFVHALADKQLPLEALVADPIVRARLHNGSSAPHIPLPGQLYGADRHNSQGFDLGYAEHKERLESALARFDGQAWPMPPVSDARQVDNAMEKAQAAFDGWNTTPVTQRAILLEAVADALEANREEAYALCLHEASKILPDAIAEVREAADFCRYYAARSRDLMAGDTLLPGPTGERNTLQLSGRGVFVCISPWNFPLAIFVGQVAAALVTGNCVVAKPADQTPRISAFAVKLMHKAGIPEAVLQLLYGNGRELGEALVAHPHTAGVVFTGSTATARAIYRNLAGKTGPIVPLIAETGGQNCMVIDSSALLEQAVDDVIVSAFGSSGQRCSALRVLYVQEEVADKFLALLSGAMQEYRLGEPLRLDTDFGPVIDATALERLQQHVTDLEKQGAKRVAAIPFPSGLEGFYFAPCAFEIPNIHILRGEVFGPVLHVVRWKSTELDKVIAEVNSTGYGLTFGIQSRIKSTIDSIRGVRAGNIYVNRSMIGAVVGVQPFGGEGLSGTGPKAGGPHYLSRFVLERTLSVNTAAIGGNVELLK